MLVGRITMLRRLPSAAYELTGMSRRSSPNRRTVWIASLAGRFAAGSRFAVRLRARSRGLLSAVAGRRCGWACVVGAGGAVMPALGAAGAVASWAWAVAAGFAAAGRSAGVLSGAAVAVTGLGAPGDAVTSISRPGRAGRQLPSVGVAHASNRGVGVPVLSATAVGRSPRGGNTNRPTPKLAAMTTA